MKLIQKRLNNNIEVVCIFLQVIEIAPCDSEWIFLSCWFNPYLEVIDKLECQIS